MAQPIPPVEALSLLPGSGGPEMGSDRDAHYRRMLAITSIEETWQSWSNGEPVCNQVQSLDISDIAGPGAVHRRLYTAPAEGDTPPPFRVVNILGYTESIDAPYIKKYHAYLSAKLPDIPVSTEATYGIDGTANNIGALEKLGLGHDKIAKRMFAVMQYTYPDVPIVPVATSQGASVQACIRQLNELSDAPLAFKDQLLYEPFLLAKEEKCIGRLARFIGGHVVFDGLRELIMHTRPDEVVQVWWDQARSGFPLRELPAIGGHGIGNLRRTPSNVLAGMLSRGALIIQGDKDCLGCEATNTLPGVELMAIKGKGHSMGMHPLKRAISVEKALRRRGHLPATA